MWVTAHLGKGQEEIVVAALAAFIVMLLFFRSGVAVDVLRYACQAYEY